MANFFKVNRGTAAQRAASSAVPAGGSGIGVETDTGNFVVPDGTSTWANLARLLRNNEVSPAIMQAITTTIVTNSNLTALAAESGYLWALVDSTGRIAWGITPDGTTVAQKLSLAAGSVPLSSLSTAVQTALLASVPPESGVYFAIADPSGHMALYVAPDGTVTIPKFAPGAASIPLSALSAAVQAAIPSTYPVESGYTYEVTDSGGRVGLGLKGDGSVFAKGIHPHPIAVNTNYILSTYLDANGRRQLKSTSRSTGKSVALTSSGNNVSPSLTSDDKVIFQSDATGTYQPNWVPAVGGTVAPLFSLRNPIFCAGDSLTAGTNATASHSYPDQLGWMLGQWIVNSGAGGQTSEQIAARAGGTPATVTFGSNTIAATLSAQTVTVSLDLFYGSAGGFSGTGTIGGVHGTLASSGTNGALTAYTFTRDTAGSSVALTGATNFVPDTAPYASQMQGYCIGRNNFKTDTAAQIVADIQSIITPMTALSKRFFVLAIPPSVGEETTTPVNVAPGGVRHLLDAANAAQAAAFPNNWISSTNLAGSPLMIANPGLSFADSAAFLRTDLAFTLAAAAYPGAGITKTSQDITDITNGLTPTTFRTNTTTTTVDSLHPNEYGYYLFAYLAYQLMTAKGWLL